MLTLWLFNVDSDGTVREANAMMPGRRLKPMGASDDRIEINQLLCR